MKLNETNEEISEMSQKVKIQLQTEKMSYIKINQ